jgi:hypothetical protein
MKGVAKAEFQFKDISAARKKEFTKDTIDTVLFESMIPQEYTFNDAKALLEKGYDKLNYGEKLNVIRAYATEICGDLDIRSPEIYFAKYSLFYKVQGICGCYHTDSGVITVNSRIDSNEIKMLIPHELKHYHQELIRDGYVPSTMPDEETKKNWDKKEEYIYEEKPTEIDANEYSVEFASKHFKPFYELIAEKEFIKVARKNFDKTNLKKQKAEEEEFLRKV